MINWRRVIANASSPSGIGGSAGASVKRAGDNLPVAPRLQQPATDPFGYARSMRVQGDAQQHAKAAPSSYGFLKRVSQGVWNAVPSFPDDHYRNMVQRSEGGIGPPADTRDNHTNLADDIMGFFGRKAHHIANAVTDMPGAEWAFGRHGMGGVAHDTRGIFTDPQTLLSMMVPGGGKGGRFESAGGRLMRMMNEREAALALEKPSMGVGKYEHVQISPSARRYAAEYFNGGGMGNKLGMNEKYAGAMRPDAEYPMETRDITGDRDMLAQILHEGGHRPERTRVLPGVQTPSSMMNEQNVAAGRIKLDHLAHGAMNSIHDQAHARYSATSDRLQRLGLPTGISKRSLTHAKMYAGRSQYVGGAGGFGENQMDILNFILRAIRPMGN